MGFASLLRSVRAFAARRSGVEIEDRANHVGSGDVALPATARFDVDGDMPEVVLVVAKVELFMREALV
jgi:hypothetical protein